MGAGGIMVGKRSDRRVVDLGWRSNLTITPNTQPITLKDWEVLAILDGRKTQYRQPLAFQPELPAHWIPGPFDGGNLSSIYSPEGHSDSGSYCGLKSPFGRTGDRVWGKEPYWRDWRDPGVVIYDATPEYGKYRNTGEIVRSTAPDGHQPTREECRAAMLPKFWSKNAASRMPRWAARIVVEVVNVRAERLEKLTEADAGAEGFVAQYGLTACNEFALEWDRGRKEPSHRWGLKPWVYVLEFRRVEP